MPSNWFIESLDQEEVEDPFEEGVDVGDPTLNAQSQNTTSLNESGMVEVRRVVRTLGINVHSIRTSALPLEEVTRAAVVAFLDGTGPLLYLWTREEALDLVKPVLSFGKRFDPAGCV
jgi:hypothetical protein